jgi:hypothetical protein
MHIRHGWVVRAAWALLAFGVSATVGCAGDKGEIDRVQPSYVKKSELLGSSWYYRRTVVDAPETMGPYASIGTGDLFTLERIRWEVQENYLYAMRDYEYVPGSGDQRTLGGDFKGSVIAAFPIESHFDIVNEYNSATGEKTNVRSENTTDRTWYEREFMRVRWDRNESPTLDLLIPLEEYGIAGPGITNQYVHEDDAANPYRAHLTVDKGYMDFVVNHYVEPDYETCYTTFDSLAAKCAGGEVKVRHAFLRINPEERAAYQPLAYPDSVVLKDAGGREITDPATGEVKREGIFERFGYYRLERLTYDHERELTESGRLYRILRFNIWDKAVNAKGEEIPYAQRTPKAIHYYLNADFPHDLRGAAQEVAAQWNTVFKNTVASLQGKKTTEVPDMFILHENGCSVQNVEAYYSKHEGVREVVEKTVGQSLTETTLLNYCSALEYHTQSGADAFVWQQMGDPRYNMLYWINTITPSGFAGYGPMLADPMSGEIIASSAYIMGWTIEDAATKALEYIDYMNGKISLDEVLRGLNLPVSHSSNAFHPGNGPVPMDDAVQKMASANASESHMQSLEGRFNALKSGRTSALLALENGNHYEERFARIKGTATERDYLTRNEDLLLASKGQWRVGSSVSKDLLEEASSVHRIQEKRQARENALKFLHERTFCPAADLDGALVGLAKKLASVESKEERRNILRAEVFKAVSLHELGHNVGLRHNFEGSYDALNFNDNFWSLQLSNKTEQEKLDAQQTEYKYSSIMDYHGRINADFQGLGKYDNAAVKFGYGQLVETFVNKSVQGGKALRQFRFANDYTDLPAHVGGLSVMKAREDVSFDWTQPMTPEKVKSITDHEVPYMFCSDEYASRTPTCKRFDFGANQREVVAANYVKYKNYFIFTNYLRGRLTLNWAAVDRGSDVFRDVVTTYQYMYLYRDQQEKILGRGVSFFDTDLGKDMATAVANGLNMMGEVLASPEPGYYYACTDAANQVSYYPLGYLDYDPAASGADAKRYAQGPNGSRCDLESKTYLGAPDAQPLFLDFTDDFTDWTFSYVGNYWDKQAAVYELADPTAVYYRINGFEDWRRYSVSLYRLYNKEVLGVMDRLIRYDLMGLASRIDTTGFSEDNRVSHVSPVALVDVQSPVGTPAVPVSSGKVVPSMARNLQRFSLLIGNAMLSSPFDTEMDFSKHTRVFLKGALDDISTYTSASQRAECTLPTGGQTYRAVKVAEGTNIGYDLVSECARYASELAQAKAVASTATGDALAEAQKNISRASSQLARLEQILQYTRLIHLAYEHGAEL